MMVDADLERVAASAAPRDRRPAAAEPVTTMTCDTCNDSRAHPRHARRAIGVIGLGYVGLPLAVEFAQRRVRRHRLRRRRRRRSPQINAGQQLHPATCRARTSRPCVKAGKLRATDRHVAARRRWTRSTSACRRRCARPRTPTCRTSSRRSKRSRATLRRGPARHPRVDDVSGHDRRSRAADARGRGAQGRTSTSFSRSRPSASIPATRQFNTRNIPKVVGGVGAGQHRGRGGALRRDRSSTSCRSARRASPRW